LSFNVKPDKTILTCRTGDNTHQAAFRLGEVQECWQQRFHPYMLFVKRSGTNGILGVLVDVVLKIGNYNHQKQDVFATTRFQIP